MAATMTMADDLAQLADAYQRRGDDFAWQKLRTYGEALATIGGGALMAAAYDRALERHGFHALPGVVECWDGIEGWRA